MAYVAGDTIALEIGPLLSPANAAITSAQDGWYVIEERGTWAREP